MHTLKNENGEDLYGLFHESFSPLPLHVDSGFDENGSVDFGVFVGSVLVWILELKPAPRYEMIERGEIFNSI